MRALGTVTVAALSGVVLWKLFAAILLPLLGVMIGLLATTVKLTLVVAVIFFLYSLIRKRRSEAEA